MIFFEEHLWGTAIAITTDICLTKDWNKNIICQLHQAIRKYLEEYIIKWRKPSKGFLSVYKFWSVNYKSSSVKCVIYYLHQSKWYKAQKLSPRGALLKRCSVNPQQIYSRAPMQKCYATLLKSHFLMGLLV